ARGHRPRPPLAPETRQPADLIEERDRSRHLGRLRMATVALPALDPLKRLAVRHTSILVIVEWGGSVLVQDARGDGGRSVMPKRAGGIPTPAAVELSGWGGSYQS